MNLEQNFAAKPNKKAWIYLGKVKPDTDEDVIRNYISRKLPEADELIVEKLNSAGKNESFKIGINFVFKDNISSAGIWPVGVLIRRFHFGKKPFLGETGEPTNENSQAPLEGTS
ncbi:hypothetical protein TcasGA2_TC016114 [Tribolium castaneum]|uniref:DUF4780 domain-containing protein n=1 Tax=Tribolium castaneum TaxID=7070 RepID=D7EIR4_TRICA|nr:hypothetical protein TcasGA2_TC016114 [Tribolium castaneum]